MSEQSRVDPSEPANPLDLARTWASQGAALAERGDLESALESFRRAAELAPRSALIQFTYANALLGAGRFSEAISRLDQTLALAPKHAAVWSNLGLARLALNQPEAALQALDRAVALDPDSVAAHSNRGLVQRELLLVDEAFVSFERALQLDPDHAPTRSNLAICQLLVGRFAEGWASFEARWQTSDGHFAPRHLSAPQWAGEAVAGKTILLHAEQGLGDTLQFCRYAKPLALRGARVVLEVQPALKTLLEGLDGVSELIARGEPLPHFDLHCPLMSLPGAFQARADTIPSEAAYLTCPQDRLVQWRTRLGPRQGLRVGVVWFGKETQHNNHNRSIPLEMFLSALPAGIEVFSLHDRVREEEAELLARSGVIRRFESEIRDFADTAAIACQMDLVVSVCTSAAHLAAGLGLPTWVLLPYSACWRWQLGREDSPWYPSVRLFRQPSLGDWGSVLARVRTELAGIRP